MNNPPNSKTPRTDAFAKQVGRIIAQRLTVPIAAEILQKEIDARVGQLEKELNEMKAAIQLMETGQSYIPREVVEKMYEALNESKISILDLVKYFDTLDTTRSALEGNMVILEEALQIAQSFGLGKESK